MYFSVRNTCVQQIKQKGMLYAYWKTKNLLLHDVLSLSGNGKHCILTDDYKSFATHHQHCVFQDILVGNHSFFLLLSAPCTSPPWSCLWWDATARSQHAHSSPAQHCSPAGMVLNILKIQRGLSHLPNVPKATKCRDHAGTRSGPHWNSVGTSDP